MIHCEQCLAAISTGNHHEWEGRNYHSLCLKKAKAVYFPELRGGLPWVAAPAASLDEVKDFSRMVRKLKEACLPHVHWDDVIRE